MSLLLLLLLLSEGGKREPLAASAGAEAIFIAPLYYG